MKNLEFCKNGIYLQFCVDDENRLIIRHIGTGKSELPANRFFPRRKSLSRAKTPTTITAPSIRDAIFSNTNPTTKTAMNWYLF